MKGDRVLVNVIEVSNLRKAYKEKIAVDDLSFTNMALYGWSRSFVW